MAVERKGVNLTGTDSYGLQAENIRSIVDVPLTHYAVTLNAGHTKSILEHDFFPDNTDYYVHLGSLIASVPVESLLGELWNRPEQDTITAAEHMHFQISQQTVRQMNSGVEEFIVKKGWERDWVELENNYLRFYNNMFAVQLFIRQYERYAMREYGGRIISESLQVLFSRILTLTADALGSDNLTEEEFLAYTDKHKQKMAEKKSSISVQL